MSTATYVWELDSKLWPWSCTTVASTYQHNSELDHRYLSSGVIISMA